MKHLLLSIVLMLISGSAADAALQAQEVRYQAGGTAMQGYLAYDDNLQTKRPGVLIVHEWWGLNDHARETAEKLAELGYTALAVDMYGEGKTAEHPSEAGTFAKQAMSDSTAMRERFEAALELLRSHETTDPEKIAAIGYCFGGRVVLEMARQGLDLKGVVSLHGSLAAENPAQPGEVKAAVLVLHGGADHMVTPQQVEQFEQEMKAAGADYKVVTYADAKHSFTNPKADEIAERFNMPVGYNEEAARQSWEDMKEFLARIFSEPSV